MARLTSPRIPRLRLRRPRTRLLAEVRGVGHLARVFARWKVLRRAPRGDVPVLVAPGFLTGRVATWPLRSALASLGHDVHDWSIGRNDGDVERLLPPLRERVHRLARAKGPLHLVGWSLGGTLLREIAREQPGDVAQVITLGSPVVGGAKYTAAAHYYGRVLGLDLDAIERDLAAREQVPIQVPVISLYDPSDGIVCPTACLDHYSRHATHIAVRCGHAGFGFSPEVYAIVAERLVEPIERRASLVPYVDSAALPVPEALTIPLPSPMDPEPAGAPAE